MKYLMQKVTYFAQISAWASGFVLVATCMLIAAEVFLRKLLNYSIIGVDEITGYVLAITSAWTFGFTAIKGGHIRVDSLITQFPLRIRNSLDLLANFSLFLLALILTYHAKNVLIMSFSYSSVAISSLQTPLWIPQLIWFLGMIFFTLCTLLILLAKIWGIINEKLDRNMMSISKNNTDKGR
jgi:TRAP-type C4-dicarboxylate transport system permease small subunit